MSELIHVTREGFKRPISKLSDAHILNILRKFERLAESGHFFEGETIFGEDALEKLSYEQYLSVLIDRAKEKPRILNFLKTLKYSGVKNDA